MTRASTPVITTLHGPHVHLRNELTRLEQGSLSIASAPILYGLAAYTVMSVCYDSKSKTHRVFRLADHLVRLKNSAKIVGMSIDDELVDLKLFSKKLKDLLKANNVRGEVLIRCTLFTDEILAGTKSHGLPTSLSMYAYSGPRFYDPLGIHVGVSSWRRTPDACIPSRAKINGSYVNASLMKNQALMEGYDDAIALDMEGHVTEATVANIFMVRGGRLITPDPSADILEGITRDSIIQLAESYGLTVEQRQVDRSELYIADELFLTGTSANVTPVLSVDRRPVGTGKAGPLTQRLQEDYELLRCGKRTFKPEWLTVI